MQIFAAKNVILESASSSDFAVIYGNHLSQYWNEQKSSSSLAAGERTKLRAWNASNWVSSLNSGWSSSKDNLLIHSLSRFPSNRTFYVIYLHRDTQQVPQCQQKLSGLRRLHWLIFRHTANAIFCLPTPNKPKALFSDRRWVDVCAPSMCECYHYLIM